MLNNSDLDAAVAEGILSKEQALQLRDFASRLAKPSDEVIDFSVDTRDEPFRLLKGFRDVFIALGLIIFAVGTTATSSSFYSSPGMSGLDFNFASFLVFSDVLIAAGLLAIGILLAEWVTRIQRLPLSSLIVSMIFAIWSGLFSITLVAYLAPEIIPKSGADIAGFFLIPSLGAVIGLALFYWRYRLPFALLPLVGAAVIFIYTVMSSIFSPAGIEAYQRPIIGGLGAMVFLLAMWFDMKDRLRITRFSECAFWLHLLAAPMLVHSFLLSNHQGTPNLGLVLGTIAALSLLALIIDRRALLVSGLGYFSVAISQIVSSSSVLKGMEFSLTASILGAAVLCLGLGWTSIRYVVLSKLPLGRLKDKLPPIAAK